LEAQIFCAQVSRGQFALLAVLFGFLALTVHRRQEMKEQLVSLLISKVGLDEEKANQAVDTVLDFVKDNPEQITEYLSKFGLGGVAEKLGGLGGMLGS
jgi:hypothetical protein